MVSYVSLSCLEYLKLLSYNKNDFFVPNLNSYFMVAYGSIVYKVFNKVSYMPLSHREVGDTKTASSIINGLHCAKFRSELIHERGLFP